MKQILFEILQTSAQVNKSLISSIQAFNEAEVEDCQKHTKDAQQLLKTMKSDIFLEFLEEESFNIEVNDYDLATQEELIKQLSIMQYHISLLLSLLEEENSGLIEITKKQVANDITTVTEIINQLFDN